MDKQQAIELIEKEKKVLQGMSVEEKVLTIALMLLALVAGVIGWIILRWIF